PGMVRVLFALHRPADDPVGRRQYRGYRGDARRVLVRPRDTSSLASHRGSLGDRRDGDVSDLFRRNERGVRARRPFGFGGAVPARSVGDLALDSYGTGDRGVRRGAASAAAIMTLNARAWLALAILTSTMCALLFGTAGTMRYWEAWVYVSIFLGASLVTTV